MKKIIISIAILLLVLTPYSMVEARAKNNNPMLKDIKINEKSIEPEFQMFTTEYVLTVGEEIEEVKIEPILDDENATVEVKGDTTLKTGRNEFEIQVTAEDGQAKQSYYVYITKGDRKQANANLKELKIENVEMAPNFDKDIVTYALEYPESLEQLKIEAVPEAEGSKVEIIGNENLKDVTQNIEIKVTAKDNQTIKTYFITAKKAGIEVESMKGTEPRQEESEPKRNTNSIFYMITVIGAIVIIVMIGKLVMERSKNKNEK